MTTIHADRLTEIEALTHAFGMTVAEQHELVRGYRYGCWIEARVYQTGVNHVREPHCCGCWVLSTTGGDPKIRCNECGETRSLEALLAAHPDPQPQGAEKGGTVAFWREKYQERRAVIGEWHAKAVSLGYDGVAELLAFALPCIAGSGGDERTAPPAEATTPPPEPVSETDVERAMNVYLWVSGSIKNRWRAALASLPAIAELRDLRARMERAPVGEVVEIGDDDEGQPRALIQSTREELRKGVSLLFKKVRLVVCDA